MRDPVERLQDILDAIAAIERYADTDKSQFERNELLQVWFLHHLRIIGEAVRSLPDSVRNMAPDVAWQKIVGMRNILVHSYFATDTEIIWDTIKRDIPYLKPRIERLLETLKESEG